MSPKHAADSSAKKAPTRDKSVLPAKEQNLFKAVVRLYETKQLKKALKSADSILKKFPDHGETLAMKGLTLNALDKKTEATDLVRRGLRMDMKSHVCWHVYGLLYRSKRDYREAAKAYLNALRIDKDNQQILRDLALLQVQIRDYDGLAGTRRRLLTVRPNQQNNWIGFALSFHLLGNYTTAVSVLDSYHDTLTQSDEEQDRYEVSELLFYKNMLLEEGGRFQDALKHLSDTSSRIVDRLAVMETRARLYAAQGDFVNAHTHFQRLVNLNPDNHAYQHALYLCMLQEDMKPSETKRIEAKHSNSVQQPAMTFQTSSAWCASSLQRIRSFNSDEDINRILELCDEIVADHPYSLTAQRIALDIIPSAKHPQFKPRVDAYVRKFLRKGIPSLFSDLKPLYTDPTKAELFGSLFESYLTSLDASNALHLPPPFPLPVTAQKSSQGDDILDKDGGETNSSSSTVTAATSSSSTSTSSAAITVADSSSPTSEKFLEPPCTLLWVLHFLAQHYDRIGFQQRALGSIKRALQHTPTAIECYLVQSRILKHLGDFNGATDCANDARIMDLSDRYLNTKCCKHALRADRVSDAEKWVSLFTRDGDTGNNNSNVSQALYDMQCIWFEMGAAESYMRRGRLALALKKLTSIEKIHDDMVEDQFDFHSYCLRKVTLRAYVTLLRFEDMIRRHPYFAKGASRLVECQLRIGGLTDEEKRELTGEHGDIKGYAEMTEAQRKKAISKRKKQMLKQKQSHSSGGRGGSKHAHANNDGNHSTPDASGGGGKSGDGSGKAGGGGGGEKGAKGGGTAETDPNGVEALKEALKNGGESLIRDAGLLTGELRRMVDDDIRTHVLTFEVCLRRRKALAALRSVRRAQKIDGEDGDTLRIATRLAYEVSEKEFLKGAGDIQQKVFELKGDVLGGMNIGEFVSEYEKRNADDAVKMLGAGRVKIWMALQGGSDVKSAVDWMVDVVGRSKGDGTAGDGRETLQAPWCREFLLQLAGDQVGQKDVIDRLKQCFREKFAHATCF